MLTTLFQVTVDIQSQVPKISPISNFAVFMTNGLRAIMTVAALLTFGYMILGAIDWITAGGESSKIEAGRRKIMHAIIGLVILASMWAVFMVVQYFLGIDVFGGSAASGTIPMDDGTCTRPCRPGAYCRSGNCYY